MPSMRESSEVDTSLICYHLIKIERDLTYVIISLKVRLLPSQKAIAQKSTIPLATDGATNRKLLVKHSDVQRIGLHATCPITRCHGLRKMLHQLP